MRVDLHQHPFFFLACFSVRQDRPFDLSYVTLGNLELTVTVTGTVKGERTIS
jgi:hypothetical protein